jgi:DNA-binding response OmpR family regulator
VKILLVEDHKLLARSLKQALEEDGFAVDLAVAGDEADAKARSEVGLVDFLCLAPHNISCRALTLMFHACGFVRQHSTPVLVCGAIGSYSSEVNGVYVPTTVKPTP